MTLTVMGLITATDAKPEPSSDLPPAATLISRGTL